MIRKQIATILNAITEEVLGEDLIFAEDLSDIVDKGQTFMNVVSDNKAFDSVIGAIINKVGKTIIVNREYSGGAPTLIRDAWEYGSILEKIRIDIPEAVDNTTWNLTAGTKYDDILVYDPPAVSAQYYNKKATFAIKMSFPTERQLAESFKSAAAIGRFFAGIENRIRTGMQFYTKTMEERTLNNLIALSADRRVNLFALFKADFPSSTLTAATAILSPEFLRYAAMKISLYSGFMTRLSTQFNNGEYKAHTPKKYQHFVCLDMFAKAVDVYSLSDTYHNEFVKLVNYETVPYWQGVQSTEDGEGTTADPYMFTALSKISVYPSDTDSGEGGDNPTTVNGVIGVLFDRDAAAVCCENERVTSFYNAENETTKYYYKWDCAYQNDLNENCIVFTIEDID